MHWLHGLSALWLSIDGTPWPKRIQADVRPVRFVLAETHTMQQRDPISLFVPVVLCESHVPRTPEGPLDVSHHHNEHHPVMGRSPSTHCRNAMHVQTGGVSGTNEQMQPEYGTDQGERALLWGAPTVVYENRC